MYKWCMICLCLKISLFAVCESEFLSDNSFLYPILEDLNCSNLEIKIARLQLQQVSGHVFGKSYVEDAQDNLKEIQNRVKAEASKEYSQIQILESRRQIFEKIIQYNRQLLIDAEELVHRGIKEQCFLKEIEDHLQQALISEGVLKESLEKSLESFASTLNESLIKTRERFCGVYHHISIPKNCLLTVSEKEICQRPDIRRAKRAINQATSKLDYEIAYYEYQKIYRQAVQEVREKQVSFYEAIEKNCHLRTLEKNAIAFKTAEEERFQRGLVSCFETIQASIQALQTQDNLLQSEQEIITSLIDYYQSLGAI